ncbi:hypothetical protein SeMB42_g04967 [Synchytrium endobioticum]|uniref:DNA replication complex GINS protein PSF3 n=1 Tax=Synchytrium endobioticum TaxID=286115 RepID=A0A507CUX0_9FUNG|nr:hypothetical protein SeMB42_g04967 [Synchytrium endobioticum]TPX46430.1 hypothetical protein SeLEV6574_g03234 [Synchytrium endobioticum]
MSSASDYYDIEAILADQQRVPCFFSYPVPGYGFLDGNNDADLPPNTRVELPYWMAETLAIREWVEIDLPKYYQVKVRNDLKASPTVVNLYQLCPYFYEFGIRIVNLIVDDVLCKVLSETFTHRVQLIMNYTQATILRTDRSDFIQSLDETEKDLYRVGVESTGVMIRWIRSRASSARIMTADVLTRDRSR